MTGFPPTFAIVSSFLDSTGIGQGIVILLTLGSIVGWTAMGFRLDMYRRVHRETNRFYKAFRHESHPMALFLRQQRFQDCPAYKVYLRACGAALRALNLDESVPLTALAGHPLRERDLQAIRDAAERQLAEEVLHLEDDMPIIATVTTAAPFLGLLGTVWGVMDAFGGMAVTGNPTLSAVAPGISAALLTTVVGLLVAIPSLIGYNLLNNMLRKETVAMDNFVQELVGEFHFSANSGD
jgi:biopolymer transport protein TolQ